MKKFNIRALMLLLCVYTVQHIGAQVVRVYTNDGAIREISSVQKVKFHPAAFFGRSLYRELQNRKNYTTTLRLIDDVGYTNKLSAQSNFTLFAASDAAYADFFKNNAWGVASYEELSIAQKQQLLKMSLLNEACPLNVITTTEDGEDAACLRRTTLASEVDFVAPFSPSELPAAATDDLDAFKALRNKGAAAYLSTTGTNPMLNQFYLSVLKSNNIPVSDIELIMGGSWNTTGYKTAGFVNDCRIIEGDITCTNGFIHLLDKVLFSAGSTAELIRTNVDTKLFNILLQRFEAPYYSAELTAQYNQDNRESVDSVYEVGFMNLPAAQHFYSADQRDIPTMFIPSDEAVVNYFVKGGGAFLIEEYGKYPNTIENLAQNLMSLPSSLVVRLTENLMGHNFTQTTPSKFRTIYDVDMNELFPGYATAETYYQAVVKQCLHANNGIVYVTNVWPSITELSTVIAPLNISDDTKIFKAVATADDHYIQGSDYSKAPLKQYFSTYLKTVPNHFSFFVPTDEALGSYGYVDPVGYATVPYGKYEATSNTKRYYWKWAYDGQSKGAVLPIEAKAYCYNPKKGQQDKDRSKGNAYVSKATDYLTSNYGVAKRELLIEAMNQHFIVHESDNEITSGRKYFMSRSGAPVYVASTNGSSYTGIGLGAGSTLKGGLQLMLDADEYVENDHAATIVRAYDFTETTNGQGNGMTYIIDRPLQPTMRSVYNVMNVSNEQYGEAPFINFYALADPESVSERALVACGLIDDDLGMDERQREKLKYLVFVRKYDNVGTSRSYCPAHNEAVVRFFNNFNYTVYVPTDEQLVAAHQNGLMTWEEIDEWIAQRTMDDDPNNDDEDDPGYERELSSEDSVKAQAMIMTLVNFVKYHFQDRSLFLDNVNSEKSYQTSCYNNTIGNFVSLKAEQTPWQITLTDALGNRASVIDEEGKCNILARDINYDNADPALAKSVKNSSYVVVHQIDNYLNFNSEADYEAFPDCPKGRFDIWNYIEDSTSKTKALKSYVAKYKPQL